MSLTSGVALASASIWFLVNSIRCIFSLSIRHGPSAAFLSNNTDRSRKTKLKSMYVVTLAQEGAKTSFVPAQQGAKVVDLP